jgi:DNA-binding NarL/FixJ family response regulator
MDQPAASPRRIRRRRGHLAPKTVEAHVAHIFTTLGLPTDDDSNRRVRAVVTLLRSTAP